MKRAIMLAPLAGLMLLAPPARAQAPDLAKECSAEVARFCPEAKANDEIMNCVEKREKLGKKKSGLSKQCYEAHEKLETPEHEKGEHGGK